MSDNQSNIVQLSRPTSRWKYSFISLMTLLILLAIGTRSDANNPPELYINRVSSVRNGVRVLKKDEGWRQANEGLSITQNGNTVNVNGELKAWAYLQYTTGYIRVHGELVLATLPGLKSNIAYQFPCTYAFTDAERKNSRLIASWGEVLGRNRTCEDGLRLIKSSTPPPRTLRPNSIEQVGLKTKSILVKQDQLKTVNNSSVAQVSGGEIFVVPRADYTLIDVNTENVSRENQIEVEVVTGSITITTAQNQQGVSVNAGQKYSYPGGISNSNCREAGTTPNVEAFLDPANWARNAIAPAELTRHLQRQQTAVANCPAPPQPPQPPQPLPQPQPIVEVPQPPPPINDIEANLQWSTSDDLDIEITDPRGQKIYYLNPNLPSGGSLKSGDKNPGCYLASSGGQEAISWSPSTAPKGQYVATVRFFSRCTDTYPPVPFTLTLKIKGQTQTITGNVSEESPTVTVPFSMP